jgi:hypothetical protein
VDRRFAPRRRIPAITVAQATVEPSRSADRLNGKDIFEPSLNAISEGKKGNP